MTKNTYNFKFGISVTTEFVKQGKNQGWLSRAFVDGNERCGSASMKSELCAAEQAAYDTYEILNFRFREQSNYDKIVKALNLKTF